MGFFAEVLGQANSPCFEGTGRDPRILEMYEGQERTVHTNMLEVLSEAYMKELRDCFTQWDSIVPEAHRLRFWFFGKKNPHLSGQATERPQLMS